MQKFTNRDVGCNSDIFRYMIPFFFMSTPAFVIHHLHAFKTEPSLRIRLFETFLWTLVGVICWTLLGLWARKIKNGWTRQQAKFVIGNFGIVVLSITMQMAAMKNQYKPAIGTVQVFLFYFLAQSLFVVFINSPSLLYSYNYGWQETHLCLFFISVPTLFFSLSLPLSVAAYAWGLHWFYNFFTGLCLMELYLVFNGKFRVSVQLFKFDRVEMKIA